MAGFSSGNGNWIPCRLSDQAGGDLGWGLLPAAAIADGCLLRARATAADPDCPLGLMQRQFGRWGPEDWPGAAPPGPPALWNGLFLLQERDAASGMPAQIRSSVQVPASQGAQDADETPATMSSPPPARKPIKEAGQRAEIPVAHAPASKAKAPAPTSLHSWALSAAAKEAVDKQLAEVNTKLQWHTPLETKILAADRLAMFPPSEPEAA